VQLNELRRLASSAEHEKKKTEDLQKLYDAKVVELVDLRRAHDNLVLEHETYCDEIERHVSPHCKNLNDLLVDHGLNPASYDVKEMFIGQVFDWLSNMVSSLASAGRSFGELGAVVASRNLYHVIYSLFKSSEDGEPSLTKSDLRQLCDVNFSWPIETSVERILVLPKNIAKNFMQTFFKKFGFGLTVAEGRHVLRKVHNIIPCLSHFTCHNHFLYYAYAFPCSF
jgi:hypothetical protein